MNHMILKQKSSSFWGSLIKEMLCAVLFVLIAVSVFPMVRVVGISMSPTLANGDFIVQRRTALFGAPSRGDVVTFRSKELSKILIKRIIGLPGDEVEIWWGMGVFVNGHLLDESGYLPEDTVTLPGNGKGVQRFHVPKDCYLVLGDNRIRSCDSRDFCDPYIPREDIIGVNLFSVHNPFLSDG